MASARELLKSSKKATESIFFRKIIPMEIWWID